MSKCMVLFLLSFFTGTLFSCSEKQKPADIHQLAAQFSELECRAYTLREQRYAIADSIRFTDDSTRQLPAASPSKLTLQERMNRYLKMKDEILSLSLRLADTIKLQLDSIVKIKLGTKASVAQFDTALSAEIAKRGCR